jgi:hypothetical protein
VETDISTKTVTSVSTFLTTTTFGVKAQVTEYATATTLVTIGVTDYSEVVVTAGGSTITSINTMVVTLLSTPAAN